MKAKPYWEQCRRCFKPAFLADRVIRYEAGKVVEYSVYFQCADGEHEWREDG
jgi:hypothetical protein